MKPQDDHIRMAMRQGDRDLACADLPSTPRPDMGRILVTGATGYIGGRLVPELVARGYRVRIMVRADSPELRERWPEAEIVVADALDLDALRSAVEGIHTAYYLIHSLLMGSEDFESADIQAAIRFRTAAAERRVRRIIYLGGLGDSRARLSAHLRSRMRVAEELARGSVPVTILRAAVIIGSGSASYEILEHLVRNLPVIPIPCWARTRCQPISVRDVVKYLVGVMETTETAGQSYDIGGGDVLTYEVMLKTLAGLLGRKRLFIRWPFPSIRFFAYLASLVTPVPAAITRRLIPGSINEVVSQNDDIRRLLPFHTLSFKEGVVRAMTREEQDNVRTRWSDAYPPAHELAIKLHELKAPPRFTSSYSLLTERSAASLFRSITAIGGKQGWFNSNWLWRLRGALDRLLGGVGSARGRRASSSLRINDVIDFWRVEDLKPDAMLLLRAEMKLPGLAWLRFTVLPEGAVNRLSVTAYFQTDSLWGWLYWYACLPFHLWIFYDLIKQIEKRA